MWLALNGSPKLRVVLGLGGFVTSKLCRAVCRAVHWRQRQQRRALPNPYAWSTSTFIVAHSLLAVIYNPNPS
ncbi:uncharacterized protein QC761_0019340 [Podospora bellae-mahoneyi]|uniref:Secreted protein n=1 Tax=Podospora bellae-mahoneyi TaxID=2093777 RepID=A0ABR0G0I5_9PEZI|nr:hypothetical protein QC761_0019340 [Podospora bellae-mahoneyi]